MAPNLKSQYIFSVKDLIQPYFIIEGNNKEERIKLFPGIYRLSIDNLIKDVRHARDLGIKAVLLFAFIRKKDRQGTLAYFQEGVVQKAIRAIKQKINDITVITDVCLCGYTIDGHCGILKSKNKVVFDKDKTRKILAKIASSHAEAGADVVAPSAMIPEQVKAIRKALDKNGFKNVGILAYSAKYASNFYGPFREALDSSPRFGDRRGYQLDYRNSDEALREIEQDIKEGADIVMVKPALAYLDIIAKAKQKFHIPISAYNVSGEYAMIKYYSRQSSLRIRLSRAQSRGSGQAAVPSTSLRAGSRQPERELVLEILTSIKRAGADLIITYFAKDVARWLKAE